MRAAFSGPVLLATRDLDRSAAIADRMLVLDAGRILRRGTPREILEQPESVEVARRCEVVLVCASYRATTTPMLPEPLHDPLPSSTAPAQFRRCRQPTEVSDE